MGCRGRLGLGDPLCGGCLIDACWWVRWVCVGGDGRIGRASEVGVYKSADVCIVDFAVGRGCCQPSGFIVFISENVLPVDHSCSEVRCRREAD